MKINKPNRAEAFALGCMGVIVSAVAVGMALVGYIIWKVVTL